MDVFDYTNHSRNFVFKPIIFIIMKHLAVLVGLLVLAATVYVRKKKKKIYLNIF